MIIHIGNIPKVDQMIFTTEFIQLNEPKNNFYEFEFFQKIPVIRIFLRDEIETETIKGFIEIKTNDENKMQNIQKK